MRKTTKHLLDIPQENPGITPEHSEAKESAKNLLTQLKTAYPKVIFSIYFDYHKPKKLKASYLKVVVMDGAIPKGLTKFLTKHYPTTVQKSPNTWYTSP